MEYVAVIADFFYEGFDMRDPECLSESLSVLFDDLSFFLTVYQGLIRTCSHPVALEEVCLEHLFMFGSKPCFVLDVKMTIAIAM